MSMRQSETRFAARTRLERAILSSVNRELGEYATLNGLTDPAVRAWTTSMHKFATQTTLSPVIAVLEEFSTRAELKADESRDTFEIALNLPRALTDGLLLRLSAAAAAVREGVKRSPT